MRHFTPNKYDELTEINPDPILALHMKDEQGVLRGIDKPEVKTLIDLGAGSGRILPFLAQLSPQVIAIENNAEMLQGLKNRARDLPQVTVVNGDITNLENFLSPEISNPVLILLQNTLGTIDGKWEDVLTQIRTAGTKCRGEAIVSLFKQEALHSWGLQLYQHNAAMSGDPDLSRIDFEKGTYVSETDYISKWWTKSDRDVVREQLGGKINKEVETDYYYIFHLSYH